MPKHSYMLQTKRHIILMKKILLLLIFMLNICCQKKPVQISHTESHTCNNQGKVDKMKELFKELETILIENGNPILDSMDVEASRKSEEDIKNSFKALGLECCPELLELYKWKSGCNEKILFYLEDFDKALRLCSFGNLIAYPISAKMYNGYQQFDQYWFTDSCLVPITSDGILRRSCSNQPKPKEQGFEGYLFLQPSLLSVSSSDEDIRFYRKLVGNNYPMLQNPHLSN